MSTFNPSDTEQRQQKIIIALFLCLGKAMNQLSAKNRNEIKVTETEIRDAWKKQTSPVRLISSVDSFCYYGQAPERTYKVVIGDLDLQKTGMDFHGKMPEEPKAVPNDRPRRVFDLE